MYYLSMKETNKGNKMNTFEYNNYKANDKGQSQIVFKEIYRESNYLNSANYQINHPHLENDWGCQEGEWNYNTDVYVEKQNHIARDVYKDTHQKEDKEIFTINLNKQFGFDRSTSVALNLDREQLEKIVEQAQFLLEK